MFKTLKMAFTSSPEQTYLEERLQSAKFLGWDMHNPAQAQATETMPDAAALATASISGKPA